jgi:carbamate kinase
LPAREKVRVSRLTVIALGGNALMQPGERGTASEQRANLAKTFRAIQPLLDEGPFVVTHGNGPQVGNELLRQELASAEAPPLPLYVAVAQTQAEIGALIAAELEPVARRSVAVVMTRVEVDEADDAFQRPTKPVGPFYDHERAQALERERGWAVVEDAGRGWRRVVPSPRPIEVLELGAIGTLVERGFVVVAAGGGGVPVVARDGRHDGVDAVIDKDHASALLAVGLGAERLVILTQVHRPGERPRARRDSSARKHAPEGRGCLPLRRGNGRRGSHHERRGPGTRRGRDTRCPDLVHVSALTDATCGLTYPRSRPASRSGCASASAPRAWEHGPRGRRPCSQP